MAYITPKRNISKYYSLFLTLMSFILLIITWFILNNFFGIDEIVLPTPANVAGSIIYLFADRDIIRDLMVSLFRVITGFSIALIIGIPVGILCGIYKPVRQMLETYFNFLRFIPVAAIIPLIILWFGVGETGKILLIFIRALPYLVLYISNAAANVEKEYIEAGRVMGCTQKQILSKIVFPRILPQIWDISRIEYGSSWSTVILAEVLGANSGIGYRLVLAQRYVHITELFSLIIICAAIALLTDFILRIMRKKLFPWSEKARLMEI